MNDTVRLVDQVAQAHVLMKQAKDRWIYLTQQQSKYDAALSDLDHQMEIRTLNAPQLARVNAYRKRLLLERRAIKQEMHEYKVMNVQQVLGAIIGQLASAEKKLKAIKYMEIEDNGLIDRILQG